MAVQEQDRSTLPDAPAHSALSDARLVELARHDRDAFGELVVRYERRLTGVLMRFVSDPDQVEDLVQETFLRVYGRLDQFDPSRRFGPWLFQVGVNLTLDWLRKCRRRILGRVFSSTPNVPEPASPDPRMADDTAREVRHLLEKLPEKYRTVLILRDLENFSTSEIAAILNRKETTVRWRLAEARNRFRELWERRSEK